MRSNSVKQTRPAMGEDQWQRCWTNALLVKEMDIGAIDRSNKLRKLIEPRFLRTPVEPVPPVIHKLVEEVVTCAIVPGEVIQCLRPARHGQTLR